MYQNDFHRFENAENSVPRKMVEVRHRPWRRNYAFFTFVVPIDRRKTVLTADQIIFFLRASIVPHGNVENKQFFSGRQGLRWQF